MGYAYEDDDLITSEEESSEVVSSKTDDDSKNSSEVKKEVLTRSKENNEFIVNNLLTSDDSKQVQDNNTLNYSVNNLLDSEEDSSLYYDELLTKKDEKLFHYYLGNNYEKITDNKWNGAAFLFGGVYLIYRKCYGIGIFWLFICVGVQFLLPIVSVKWYIIFLFELLAAICCGFLANQIILNNVGTKISNLKLKKRTDIKEKMIKTSSTNIFMALIFFVVSISLSSIYVYNTFMAFNKRLEDYKAPKFIIYNGELKINESNQISKYFKIDEGILNGYSIDSTLNTAYRSHYIRNDSMVSYAPRCSVGVAQAGDYKDAYSLIEQIVRYETLDKENIKTYAYNSREWYTIDTDKTFFATTFKDNKIFVVYHNHYNLDETGCYMDYQELLKAILEQ